MPKAVRFTVALDNTACGWVRLIASPAAKARAALERAGYAVCARQVVTVIASDRPKSDQALG